MLLCNAMQISSDIRGHHIYKEVYVYGCLSQGKLQCDKEEGKSHNLYAFAVKKLDLIVGHVPHMIPTLCHLFLSKGGSITCMVTGIGNTQMACLKVGQRLLASYRNISSRQIIATYFELATSINTSFSKIIIFCTRFWIFLSKNFPLCNNELEGTQK